MAVWAVGHFALLSIFTLLKPSIIYGQKDVQLSVQFANGSTLDTLTFSEGAVANLSCPQGTRILIDGATYGVPGGQSSYSVTPVVKKPCHGNSSCSIEVTSSNLQLSWFKQNETKVLSIRYSCETVYQLCQQENQHVTSQRGFVTLGASHERYCSITIETKNSVAVILEKLSKAPQFYEFVLCNTNKLVIGVREDTKCPPVLNPSQMLPSVRLPPNLTIEINMDFLQTREVFLAFKGIEPVHRFLHIPDPNGDKEQTTDVSISSAPSVQRKSLFPDWLPIALGVGASSLLVLVIFVAAIFLIRPKCRQGSWRLPSCCRSKEMEYMEVATDKKGISVRGRHNGHLMDMLTDSVYQDNIYERIDLTLRRSALEELEREQTMRSLTSDEGIGSTLSSASGSSQPVKTCREPRSSLPPVPSGGSPRLPNGSSNMAELRISPYGQTEEELSNHKYDNAESLLQPNDLEIVIESDLDSVSSDLEIVDNELYSQCRPVKRSHTKET